MRSGKGKFYLAQARLQRAGPEQAQTLFRDFARGIKIQGHKPQGGNQGAFGIGFQERV